MEWNNRNGISLIGLISFLISLSVASWLYIRNLELPSQIVFILAEASISIPITLIIIEWVIKRDRKNQWAKVRSITYMTILNNLFQILYLLPICIPAYVNYGSTNFIDIIVKMNKHDLLDPQLYDAIKEFTEMISIIPNRLVREDRKMLGEDKWDANMFQYSDMILQYYQEIGWLLEDMRLILIPRVLQLSDDQEVNSALVNFENNIRSLVYSIRKQEIEDLPVADLAIVDLIKALQILYGILQKKCINDQ